MSKPVADYALLIFLSSILAMNFVMTKLAVGALEPALVVFSRLAIAALVLVGIMLLSGKCFPPMGPIWWVIVGSALFGHTLPFSLITWAQESVDAGLTAILMATMPLFTLLLAQVFTRDEKPNRYSVAGFALALVGIVILFGPSKLASLAEQSLRQYAAIAAAMCYGVNAIITKSLTGLAWQVSTSSFMVVAVVMSLPWLLLSDITPIPWDLSSWLPVLYSGFVPTAFGAVLIVFVVQRAGASFLSQVNFIVPVFGVLFSIAIVNEVLPPQGALALVIILSGVALARRRPRRTIHSINKGA